VCLPCLVVIVLCYDVKGIGIHLLVLICYSHAMMGMSIFYSSLFTSRRAASVIAYLLIIIVAGIAPILSLYGPKHWPWPLYIFPPFAYIRSFDLSIRHGKEAFNENSDMSIAIMMLIVMGTIWLLLGIYLNTIKFRPFTYLFGYCRSSSSSKRRAVNVNSGASSSDAAITPSPLPSPIADPTNQIRYHNHHNNGIDGNNNNGGNDDIDRVYVMSAEQLSREDIDVRNERKRVTLSQWLPNQPPAIIIRNLVKSFAKSGTERKDKVILIFIH
jgi:hypothetical protein